MNIKMNFTNAAGAFCLLATLPALNLCADAATTTPKAGDARAMSKQGVLENVAGLSDEFDGPFASWANLKRDYGARGDGSTDDTAALQKALDDLKDVKKPKVLYVPSGTYRITQTLQMASHFGVRVVGEDPNTTIIKWDGAQGGTMMRRSGVRWSSFSRLTWDGQKKAESAIRQFWDGKVDGYGTYNEHMDEVFKDVGFGLRIGVPHLGDAECAVTRCHFVHCSKFGFSANSLNSLDLWVWDSLFEDCAIGASNQSFNDPKDNEIIRKEQRTDPEGGGGHFHVYRSLFKRSTVADMTIMHTSYFGIRDNVSVGSKAFFLALRHPLFTDKEAWGAEVVLQRNRVLDAGDATPVRSYSTGPLILLDNVFSLNRAEALRARAIPVVLMAPPMNGVVVSIGNTYGRPKPISVKGVLTTLDDQLVAPLKSAARFSLPDFAPKMARRYFEIAPSADGATIQKAIDQAAKLNGKRAVVHLPQGEYLVAQTLTISANSDVQIAGDGVNGTILRWTGGGHGPVVLLRGPSHATLRDLTFRGGAPGAAPADAADGIAVENCDQPGSRIYADQLMAGGTIGVQVNGLDNALVDLCNVEPAGETALQVVGGTNAARGQSTTGRTAVWGGATSNNLLTFSLRNNGKLLVHDTWYEGSAGVAPFTFGAENSGTFAWSGGAIYVGRKTPMPDQAPIRFNGFRGSVSLVGIGLNGDSWIGVENAGETNFLGLGMMGGNGNPPLVVDASAKNAALLTSRAYTTPVGGDITPDVGRVSPEFLRRILAFERTTHPDYLTPIAPSASDVRMFRVVCDFTRNGVRFGKF